MSAINGKRIIIVGAGPAGLAAAELLAQAGASVVIHDRMPNPARKFLLAGRGGLNLTHSEPLDDFLARYGEARTHLEPAINAFTPAHLRAWCEGLEIETFVGSSGRVFPKQMKASPLLRAWLTQLSALGVQLVTRSCWTGWADNALTFETPNGAKSETADAAVFALGGASWPRLGSDGSWTALFAQRGAHVTPLRASNSGFLTNWSDIFREKFAGQPIKSARFSHNGVEAAGEAIVTRAGIEGGAIYALSSSLRDSIATSGAASLTIDFSPNFTEGELARKLASAPAGTSTANRLRRANITPVAASLLRERVGGPALPASPADLAAIIKACTITLTGLASIERAISTAGGISWGSLNPDYSLKSDPLTFVAGEMLDWEAPTGGYLLQACFATGRAAANGVIARLS
ncbi:MAG: TIGR03862 family flavoprotein [Sphingomonadales bacterium]|nr:MAG: TIGR03862 family flavoprotein [Sphingomonadales bacterium]